MPTIGSSASCFPSTPSTVSSPLSLPKGFLTRSSNRNARPVKARPSSTLHFRTISHLLRPWNYKSSSCRIFPSSFLTQVSLQNPDAVWEGPYYDSDSDYEGEKEEEEEEDSSYVKKTPEAIRYEEGLRKEVELLLIPEERSLLQHNEAAALDKIATAKWIPLHTLALSFQIPLMDKLIESGVDIDVVDKDGYTALHKAIIGKRESVISHLLRKGANPHVRDKDGATPLHYAVLVGALQTVKLLIKYKVDVNVADNEGWTPLHIAMQARCRDIAKVLLVNGADKTRRNMDGKLPLDLSLCYGRDFKSYELGKLLKLVPIDR